MKPRMFAMLAVLAVALPSVALAAPSARAELTPRELAVDTPARLTVTIEGQQEDIEPPSFRVPGAEVRYRGQMVRATIINGKARNELAFQYTVIPSSVGTLVIPPIEVKTASGVARTQAVRATVAKHPSPSRADGSRAPTDDTRSAPEPTRAFVKLEVHARTLFVGEAVPVKIRAYFRAGTAATLQGPPTLSSDAFTLSELSDKPAQTEVEIRGETYLQATWTAILSPAKPFRGKLGVELPVELAYREAMRERRSLRDLMGSDPFGGMDPFGDAFFGGDPFAGFDSMFDIDSMFDVGPVQRRELKLRATAKALDVEEPPTAGRPSGYGGAVGTFELEADPPASGAHVGEPITLSFRATGTGNFDRLSLVGIEDGSVVKAYPVKSAFAPSAESKLSGTKTFTQTIVPTKAGAIEVPAVAISFFDPVARKYITARTQPLTLDVAAARDGGGSASTTPMTSGEIDPGSYVETLQPKYRQVSFWLFPGALALLTVGLVGGAWWGNNSRVATRRSRRRVDRAVNQAVAEMDRAAAAGDATGFFHAARTALQARLGPRFAIAPDAVTAADVETHLGARGAAIRSVFEHTDGIVYARGIGASRSLDTWQALVREELTRLEVDP